MTIKSGEAKVVPVHLVQLDPKFLPEKPFNTFDLQIVTLTQSGQRQTIDLPVRNFVPTADGDLALPSDYARLLEQKNRLILDDIEAQLDALAKLPAGPNADRTGLGALRLALIAQEHELNEHLRLAKQYGEFEWVVENFVATPNDLFISSPPVFLPANFRNVYSDRNSVHKLPERQR
jgi:hypothetical protein